MLPGIGSLEKLFGKLQIRLEYYIIYLELASNFVLISGDVSLAERDYTQTKKTVNTENISGMFIVF